MQKLLLIGYRKNEVVWRADVQVDPAGGNVLHSTVGHPLDGIAIDAIQVVLQEPAWAQPRPTRPATNLREAIDRENAAGLQRVLQEAGRRPEAHAETERHDEDQVDPDADTIVGRTAVERLGDPE